MRIGRALQADLATVALEERLAEQARFGPTQSQPLEEQEELERAPSSSGSVLFSVNSSLACGDFKDTGECIGQWASKPQEEIQSTYPPDGSPRPNAEHQARPDLHALRRIDGIDWRQPGMRILDIQHPPGKGPPEDGIESASHGHREAELLILNHVSTALRKMWAFMGPHSSSSCFLLLCQFVCDPSPPKHHFPKRREAMRRPRRPARPNVEHRRIPTLVLLHS